MGRYQIVFITYYWLLIAFPSLVRYVLKLQVPLYKGDLGGLYKGDLGGLYKGDLGGLTLPHMRENRYIVKLLSHSFFQGKLKNV